jgi:hypothetical protein
VQRDPTDNFNSFFYKSDNIFHTNKVKTKKSLNTRVILIKVMISYKGVDRSAKTWVRSGIKGQCPIDLRWGRAGICGSWGGWSGRKVGVGHGLAGIRAG